MKTINKKLGLSLHTKRKQQGGSDLVDEQFKVLKTENNQGHEWMVGYCGHLF